MTVQSVGRDGLATVIVSTLVCLLFTVSGWRFFGTAHGLMLAQDWMVYHEASSAVLAGHAALLNDGVRFTEAIALRFQDVMTGGLNLHPWVYPPPFLLLILPLGLLGPTASYVTFILVGFAGLLLAIHAWPAPRWQRTVLMISAAASPAAMFTLLAGQNAFLTAALLVGGLGVLLSAPVAAGALLGLLVFKPQLAVLVPIALLAGRHWRATMAAGGSAALLSLASLAAFGLSSWVGWFRLMLGGTAQFSQWEATGRQSGMSVVACVYAVCHAEAASRLAQDVTSIVAAVLVGLVFSRRTRAPVAAAAMLLATGLAAPHYSNYDMLTGCLGATLVWLDGLKRGFRTGELMLCLLCWVAPLTFSPRLTMLAAATPACALLLLGCVVARAAPDLQPRRLGRVLEVAAGPAT